jgi:hypothetical protein
MCLELTRTLSLQLTDTSIVFTDNSNSPFIESVGIPIELWEDITLYIQQSNPQQR